MCSPAARSTRRKQQGPTAKGRADGGVRVWALNAKPTHHPGPNPQTATQPQGLATKGKTNGVRGPKGAAGKPAGPGSRPGGSAPAAGAKAAGAGGFGGAPVVPTNRARSDKRPSVAARKAAQLRTKVGGCGCPLEVVCAHACVRACARA